MMIVTAPVLAGAGAAQPLPATEDRMSALSDLLHSIVDRLPFHSQSQVDDAHALVDDAEKEVSDAVAAVKNFVQGPGVKSVADTQQPLGTDQNASTDSDDATKEAE